MKKSHAARLMLACVVVCLVAALAGAGGARASRDAAAPAPAPPQEAAQTFNLTDFGAVGDGVADDGPAVQAALDAVVRAGGGTLLVPAGHFAIATPVSVVAASSGVSLEIRGVESATPIAAPTAGGDALSRGLDLTTHFLPRTGSKVAFTFGSLRSLLIQDIDFLGTPEVSTDALITLSLVNITDAVIRHCEFYGLASIEAGGSIVQNWGGGLTIRQTAFLGCTANSGIYTPVVQNYLWESITVEDSIFIDYGQRPELYAKTGLGSPLSWINVGHATPPTAASSRREVVLRNVFLDEGGWQAVTMQPARYQSPAVPIDLFYATGLYVNVSNFLTTGLYLAGARQVMVEDSIFTWSHRADSAIQLVDPQDAILDRVRTFESATRLRAEYQTGRLTVIDSTYTDLASAAAQTVVLTPATPDDDPVRYVRAQFQTALGRAPDAAAHYYWSRKLLDCAADAACVTSQRAALAAHLARKPAATFAITGRAADENGQPLAGVAVTLTGTHSTATVAVLTGADGTYSFGRLPTSGSYAVAAGAKRHYTFETPTRAVVTPAGAQVVDFPARLNRHAVSGRLLDERGRAIRGATVTLSGAQAATTASDANGNYAFAGLAAGGNYTVTVSSARYSFATPSRSFTDLDADRTADFGGTSLFFTVNGQVVDSTNKPMAGHTVALSGGKTATAVTDAQGNFAFADLARGGAFTLTPAKLVGSTFTPASRTFDNLTADQTAAFVAVPTNFKLGGRVTSGGSGLAGVTLTLTGSRVGTATTDAQGNYSFSVPVNGDYTVAPSKTHYTFDRASQTFNGVTADRTADFVATINRHRISGSVKRPNGAAMSGVAVALSGAQTATATTDAQGNYTFASLPAGAAYTVTPSRPGYDFAPASKGFTALGADQTADFTVTPSNLVLSGRATADGAALAGVTVTLTGSKTGTATTDLSGKYSFNVTSEGAYTVTPSKAHYKFAPPSQTFNNPTAAQTADFVGTLDRHKISGRVADKNNAGLAGVSVSLTGAQSATATTDAQGNYTFANLPAGGNYAVAVSRANYSFSPSGLPFNDLGADQTANFTGTLLDYVVRGRVTSGGAALAGVAVALTGSKSGAATTDAQGNYSFTVPAEGGYTVTPSLKHHTFAPPSATFANLGGDRTADFAATLNRHTLSGRVADKGGAGLAGVAVALSGSQTATATTDAQGNYTFANLPAGGGYTLTPARANYTFSPAFINVSDLGANSAANNFTGTLIDYKLSGRVTLNGFGIQQVTVTLSGSKSGTATTDFNGAYSFTVPAEGSYTVTPSKTHHTFTPQSRSFGSLSSDQTADFAATLNRYRISGRVATASGAGVAGITVTLSGSREGTTATNAQGHFSFPDLTALGRYTVGASSPYYTFRPMLDSFEQLTGDTTVIFTAEPRPFGIVGRVTEKGVPLAGVELTLTGTHPLYGAQTGKATTGGDGLYAFILPAGGDYTVRPSKKNYAFDRAEASFKALAADQRADFAATLQTVLSFASASYAVSEGGAVVSVTVTREGDTTTETSAVYEGHGGTAKLGSDFVASIGLLHFAPGETSKTFTLFITDDGFAEGPELFTLSLTPSGGAVTGDAAVTSVTINDNDATASTVNPVDDDEFFVRQHYRDFLGREPDAPGLKFWTDEIRKCGADAACREARRVSVSAAFFLSIEFRETGYLVHRLYRATYGRVPSRVGEFMLDSRVVGEGVVVGAEGWEAKLAANKRAFLEEWVRRPEFEERFRNFDNYWFLQSLFVNMNVTPTEARRQELLAKLSAGATRAEVLAEVIEDGQFGRQELNKAFVLMQYFGYLRRNPNEAPDTDFSGLDHWLSKLNEFGGDYERAEMVKAFLSSAEYRGRFGN